MRTSRILMIAALGITTALVAATAAVSTVHPALAQAEEDETTEPAPVARLALGERFAGPGWDLEVQDAFVVESPERTDWSEVRVAVALRPTSAPLPYLWNGLSGKSGYPRLTLRDSAGELRTIGVTDPIANLVPGSTLAVIPPGVPARWTIGFQVPTAFVDDLTVEVGSGNVVLAGWDLSSSRSNPSGWEPPAAIAVTEPNEPIPWGEDLEVTPVEHTTLVCGDPDTQQVTVGYGLAVDITNLGVDDAPFPDVRIPEVAALAIWDDGSSARYSNQSHVITDELTSDPLRSETIERVMIPPRTTYQRMMIFLVPRDSRFAEVEALPGSVILAAPGQEAVWLDVSDLPQSDFVSFLDCGNVVGGHPFDVDQGGEVVQPVPVPATGDTSAP